jgi:hypothetical protein
MAADERIELEFGGFDFDTPTSGVLHEPCAHSIPEMKPLTLKSMGRVFSNISELSTAIPSDGSICSSPRSECVEMDCPPAPRGGRRKPLLSVDTSTDLEEAHDRKVLVNKVAMDGMAPRQFRRLLAYREGLLEKAAALDFPSPLSKDDVQQAVLKVECRRPREHEEFEGMFFARGGAYYV